MNEGIRLSYIVLDECQYIQPCDEMMYYSNLQNNINRKQRILMEWHYTVGVVHPKRQLSKE